MTETITYHEYFKKWMEVNKKGTVRPVTYNKYVYIQKQLAEISPSLKMKDLNKFEFQNIINIYSETHERQTIIDFYHIIKGCIKDAVADGDIDRDPTLRTKIPAGISRNKTHEKYWNNEQYEKFIKFLYLNGGKRKEDFIFLLIAKTGLRFAEAIGVCPEDFIWEKGLLKINKTFNYKAKDTKDGRNFQPTKNRNSVREVPLDYQTMVLFNAYVSKMERGKSIFVQDGKRIFNIMINNVLYDYCEQLEIPKISLHSLRHTYATILYNNGLSIYYIAKLLGHSNIKTTQQVYLHLTDERAEQDKNKLLEVLGGV